MAFTLDPEYWKKQRHALQKGLFGFEDASSYVPLFAGTIKEAVSLFPTEGSRDIHPYLNKLTFEVIHSVFFGKPANAVNPLKAKPEDLRFVQATARTFNHGGALYHNPVARMILNMDQLTPELKARIPQPVLDEWNGFCQAVEEILEIAMGRIDNALAQGPDPNAPSQPLLFRYQREGKLTNDELLLNCAGLVQAGVDTTANTMLWCLTRLGQYPTVQHKLREEIQSIGKSKAELWTADQLQSLKLLSSFVDETMRLTPTALGHLRTTLEDCEVVSHRLDGKRFRIPAGTKIMFSSQPMRNDPKFVESPHEFQLQRFTRECKHARRGTDQAKLDHPISDVFSFGPRMCLGARLAKIELLNMLAETIEQFHVGFVDENVGKQIGVSNNFLTRPDPIPQFKFTPST